MNSDTRVAMEDDIDESASMSVTRMEKGDYEFVVKNYSLHKGIGVGKLIESEEFAVGGHRWTICLYPDGKNVDVHNAGHASLFISPAASTCVVDCLYDLYILDQSGKGNHVGLSLLKRTWATIISVKGRQLTGYCHMMKRATLESYYLKDDSLKISCTIGVFSCHAQNLPLIKPPKSSIRADFGKLLETNIGADVLFKVEDENFLAHKFILAAISPVFRSRLAACDRGQQEIVIPDMESRIFKAILRFIYTGCLLEEEHEDFSEFMLESFMGKMFAAADRFELESLKKLCESYFLERVSEESVAYLFYLADLCHATELKNVCLRFAGENHDAVLQSDGCEFLRRTCSSLFLKLAGYEDNLSCGERIAVYEENPSCGERLAGNEDNPSCGEGLAGYEDNPCCGEGLASYEHNPCCGKGFSYEDDHSCGKGLAGYEDNSSCGEELAGYEDNPSCCEGRELGLCGKILMVATLCEEIISSVFWPQITIHKKCKLKDA